MFSMSVTLLFSLIFPIQVGENLHTRKKRRGPHDAQAHPGPLWTVEQTTQPDSDRLISILDLDHTSTSKPPQLPAASRPSQHGYNQLQFMYTPLEWELV